jgi:hypothetical protein
MASSSEFDLQVDEFGDRYFVAEFPAFRIFGQRYDEIIAAALQAHREYVPAGLSDEEVARRAKVVEEARHGCLGAIVFGILDLVFRRLLKSSADDTEETPNHGPRPPSEREAFRLGQVKVSLGTGKQMSANQRSLFEWLGANQDRAAQEVKAAIYKYYKGVYSEYRNAPLQGPWLALEVPEIVQGNEIDDNLRLTEVVLDRKKSSIGLVFDCTWEQEHGFGVRIDDFRVAEVGDAATASGA